MGWEGGGKEGFKDSDSESESSSQAQGPSEPQDSQTSAFVSKWTCSAFVLWLNLNGWQCMRKTYL